MFPILLYINIVPVDITPPMSKDPPIIANANFESIMLLVTGIVQMPDTTPPQESLWVTEIETIKNIHTTGRFRSTVGNP